MDDKLLNDLEVHLMTVSLFWNIQTADFESWLNPDPHGLGEMFKSLGVQAFSVHRSQDDPNSAMSCMQFADRSALDAFEAWYRPAKEEVERQNPGSRHEIVGRWVCDDIPGYAQQLA